MEKYNQHFTRLQTFLQFYKEKLMLTKKFYSTVGEGVVTVEKLAKLKDTFSDSFNLDFKELLRVFLKNEGKKNLNNYVKDLKPQVPVESEATKKRKRMMNYADALAKRERNEDSFAKRPSTSNDFTQGRQKIPMSSSGREVK